jgi:heme A synthase
MPVVVVEDRESATAQALPQAILVDQNPVETWFESINYLLTLLLLLILVSLWVLYGAWRRRREEN